MRFVALIVMIFAIPGFVMLLRQFPGYRRYLYFLIGFFPFVIAAWNLDAAFISWAGWPGQTKGMIITLLDALALAILIAARRSPWSYPFVGIFLLYLSAAVLSIAFSDHPQAAFFYVWQLSFILVVFLAVATVCTTENGARMIIAGLICGIAFQAGFAISQKMSGVLQASGTMGHQNLLGMVTHFVLYPSLAMLLASKEKSRLPMMGVLAGLIVVALGASRATIGLSGAGVVLLIGLSMLRKPNARKTKAAIAGLVALSIAAPVALISLEQRFDAKPLGGSSEERDAFERAAQMMLSDHPMGVGANQYVVIANTEGYSERAGVIWNSTSRAANVHNAYLLVAAETGYFGLMCFLIFMFTPIYAAMRFAWAKPGDPRGDLALGIGVTLIIVNVHCLYEWVFVTSLVQYMVAINLGILAGLIMQRKTEKRTALRERRKIDSDRDSKQISVLTRQERT